MSNSIDLNLGSEDNHMDSLSFYWKSRFIDNSEISQFNKEGKETLFKEVKDKFNSLTYFYLIHKSLPICFTVDLINGLIFYNNHQKIDLNLIEKKENIRLIYFRRHTVELTESLEQNSHTITYHLGIQWNDKLGNNKKIILQIDSEGNWILLGE